MDTCVFCKIRDRIIPKKFTYEDDDVMVFPDLYPLKPIHLLIIPKKHVEDLLAIDDGKLMMRITKIAQKMVKELKLENKGYRLTINGGGAQIINHLHFHLLGPLGKTVQM